MLSLLRSPRGARRRGGRRRRRTAAASASRTARLVPRATARWRRGDPRDAAEAARAVATRCPTPTPTPRQIDAALGSDPCCATWSPRRPGRRVPGCVDPGEIAIRAVLGQQVSVAAARTQAARLVERCGEPLPRAGRRRHPPVARSRPRSPRWTRRRCRCRAPAAARSWRSPPRWPTGSTRATARRCSRSRASARGPPTTSRCAAATPTSCWRPTSASAAGCARLGGPDDLAAPRRALAPVALLRRPTPLEPGMRLHDDGQPDRRADAARRRRRADRRAGWARRSPSRAGCATTRRSPSRSRQLSEYFAGERTEFDLELAPRGTEFQQRVWNLLREIPYGETTTYGALALRARQPAQRPRRRPRQRPQPAADRRPVPPRDRRRRLARRLRRRPRRASARCWRLKESQAALW